MVERRGAGVALDGGALLLVAAVAVGLTWVAGHRGVFFFDQSIVFDGGYRIFAGQRYLVDFTAPVGPTGFDLQALAFRLGGVSWRTYVLSAAVLGAAMAAIAWALARSLTGGLPGVGAGISRILALAAGLATAVWFSPPSGTLWIDHAGYPFVLVSLVAAARLAQGRAGRRDRVARALAAAAGLGLGLAAATKASLALATVPGLVVAGLAAAGPVLRRRARHERSCEVADPGALAGLALAFAVGLVAALAAVAARLVLDGAEPASIVHHLVVAPATIGGERLGDPSTWVAALGGRGPWWMRLAGLLAVGVAVHRLVGARRVDGHLVEGQVHRGPAADPGRGVAVLVIGLVAFEHLFQATGNNQPALARPFWGLVLALGVGLVLSRWSLAVRGAWHPSSEMPGTGVDTVEGALSEMPDTIGTRAAGVVLVAVLGGLLVLGTGRGVEVALERSVHDVFPRGTRFEEPLAVAGLEGLRWGEPTHLGGGLPAGPVGPVARAKDLEALVATLARSAGPGQAPPPFAVLFDSSLLHGIVGRPSPWPLLWFHPGVTYPDGGDPALDRRLEAALAGVDRLVVERASWYGTADRLADFPRLAARIEADFRPQHRFGPWELWERQGVQNMDTG